MTRPSALPPEEKTRLVLSVLAGAMSVAEALPRRDSADSLREAMARSFSHSWDSVRGYERVDGRRT